MYNLSESTDSITFELSSEMRMVDRAVKDARRFFEERDLKTFSQFKIVLREILINAVEHGNQNIPEKKVLCTISRVHPERLTINVSDEGIGFDYKHLDYKMPEDTRKPRFRGYPLIKEFSEEICFNAPGNSVTVTFSLRNETCFDIREQDGWQTIRPNGDITATIADKFRILLMELVQENHCFFRFDLESVRDMDSVALGVFFVLPGALAGKRFELEIINARQDLRNLFRVTMLEKEYRIV